ncbi:Uncharacterised protein [Yersinia pseudotuberculosis]|nr:Uncharacterised protein [Yersinia pseudotuberculosis]CNK37462.1 Uncharacterised protein [Yersinia pseudotuberculosis]SUB29640.1 Uncharacterised protein [Yersinia pseudotuberculosis]
MVGCAVTILQKLMSNRVKKSVSSNAIFAMSFQPENGIGIGNEQISDNKTAM